MSKQLNLTFQDGTTGCIPFSVESQLTVETPDGVNGRQRGSWGEIVGLTLADVPEPVEPEPTPAPVVESETPPVVEQQPEQPVTDGAPVDENGNSLPTDAAQPEPQPVDADGNPLAPPTV